MTQFTIVDNVITKAFVTSATSYVIPENVVLIKDSNDPETSVFHDLNDKLFDLSFAVNSKLQRIGHHAFLGCSKLRSIDFSNAASLTNIGYFSFGYCTSLTKLVFHYSLKSFESYGTFSQCYNFASVTFPDKVFGGSIFNYQLTKLIVSIKVGTVTLPEQLTTIGDLAFHSYKKDLVLGKNIVNLDSWAFLGYSGRYITLYGSLSRLYARCFDRCSNLIEVKFFNEVETIDTNAFVNCLSLRRIFFISSVKSIVATAFPNIKRICFYGNIDSIRGLLPNENIKQCVVLNNNRCTCKVKRTFTLVNSALTLIYISV